MSGKPPVVRASDLGVLSCHNCGLLCRDPRTEARLACPRCGAPLHRRAPGSLARTAAFLLAAAILYIPANTLTIMVTATLTETEAHTILGGIVELWQDESYDLALIVFVASILVPIFKLVVLSLLLFGTWRGWTRHQRLMAWLYRTVELIGHWSMLDEFVVVMLTGLVEFNNLAQVHAGPAALAFGAVVVLTMLASKSFDPRLIWDAQEPRDPS